MSLLLFPFIYSRNVSTFFRSFRKTVVVSHVFHSNFAMKIGEQPPRIDPLAQARCLIAVLFWSRFRRQREALWAKCAQISKLETLESLDLLIESYFIDCSFFKDHVINKIDFFKFLLFFVSFAGSSYKYRRLWLNPCQKHLTCEVNKKQTKRSFKINFVADISTTLFLRQFLVKIAINTHWWWIQLYSLR